MNENNFVAVGRIERITSTSRGLTLVVGGPGPVKALVAVQLRDAALIKLVTSPACGFAIGDVVSLGGRLDYDSETQQNVAIASADRVSRISRCVSGAAPQPLESAPAGGARIFGHASSRPVTQTSDRGSPVPPLPQGFQLHVEGDLVDLRDVPL